MSSFISKKLLLTKGFVTGTMVIVEEEPVDECKSQLGDDGTGNCRACGQKIGPSSDGWYHMSAAPDRVVQSTWSYGRLIEQILANGVKITYKY
jgi:hypothetical protein